MKVVSVIGARPQFIKASVVSDAIRRAEELVEVLVHTGQHFDEDMSSVFFEELGLQAPTHRLGIHGGGHGAMTGRMLEQLESVLQHERPRVVLVYGDTNSTLAGALAAVKLHIPVAHVEAGLRSFNMRMPEEVNRVLTDRVSQFLFTPTEIAVANLRAEGVPDERIVHVGDVMYDVARHHGMRAETTSTVLARLGVEPKGFILFTVHRAENTDDRSRLAALLDAVLDLAVDYRVVWPLHPRTRDALRACGSVDRLLATVTVVPPVGYLDMVQLERNASVVVTDSGGVQKEAFFHGVPCVTLRDETEWVELLETGWNRLAPPSDAGRVAATVRLALGTRGRPCQPYGDGTAATRIVDCLRRLG